MLPKGQFELGYMPRFGLPAYRDRFPTVLDKIEFQIGGDIANPMTISDELAALARYQQTSDFHCVTTWSASGQSWKGIRFCDLYKSLILPLAQPSEEIGFVSFRCQDGYSTCLPLNMALNKNVMLADHLNGEPLPITNGAPVRLVAPDHYGYKNAKHVSAIHFHIHEQRPKTAMRRFLDHPTARVAVEERSSGAPGWLSRYSARWLISSTSRQFKQALDDHLNRA